MNRIVNKKTLNIEWKKFFIEASSNTIASIRSALLFWENGHKWKRATTEGKMLLLLEEERL